MSKLRISDAPLLPDVDGTEKIPTGGRGDYAISVDQIKDHIFQDIGKELVGLGNVDNTSDLDKPVSTAQQSALNLKADKTYVDTNLALKADKTNVYTRSETSLALSKKADLVNGVVPENQIPSSFNDVLEFTTPNLPIIGESGKIYVTTDNNKTWRWGGNKYVEISGWNPDSVSKSVTLPTYYTKEAGVDPVTGVADGAYFNVRSSSDESYVDEYQNIGGVPTPTGKSYPSSTLIQDVRVKAPYFFNTVSAMVSANNISDGMIVGTKGYNNIFDDGGAFYLISSTATSYSIPLANGLHAVFRDTFDIRKFGIVSNTTLDQTAELARMVAYADTRIYEIDFHNFDIMTPKIWTKVLTRGVLANTTTPINIDPSDIMGLPFKKVHKLKNLKIYNDKTTRLNTSHCQIVFAPDENPAMASWFILENVTFDPWVDNYQPITENYLGNYDGLRCGFFCYPSVTGLAAPNFMTNINFHFKDIHFDSPAYSYNMTTACILCNTIIVENVTGKHLGLGLNWFAKNLFVRNFRSVYDATKREVGRSIVTNTMQFEPEVAGWGPITIDNIDVDGLEGGFNCHKVSSGSGVDTFKRVYLNNTKGHVAIYAADPTKYIVEDYQSYNHTGTYGNSATIKTFLADNFTHRVLTLSPLLPLHYGSYEKFIIRNSDFRERALTTNAINTYTCQYLEISNTWGTDTVPLLRNDIKIPNIVMRGLKYANTSNMQIIRGSWDSLTIDGITADVSETVYANSIFYNGATPAKLNLFNAVIDRPAPSADYFILAGTAGLLTANVVGSISRTPLKTNNVTLKEAACIPRRTYSKTFDWASLAAGQVQSTTISVSGAVVGDDVGCSFSQPLLGTRLWAEVTASNVVTVYQHNPLATPVDVVSGTLAVWLR